MKKLEEIFWEKGNYLNAKREVINPVPISSPISLRLGFGKETKTKIIHNYFNYCIPKTSKEYLEANSYCIGMRENNDEGSPIQLYKI